MNDRYINTTRWTHSALLVCKWPQGWTLRIGQSIWGSSMGCLFLSCSEVLRMLNFLTLFIYWFWMHSILPCMVSEFSPSRMFWIRAHCIWTPVSDKLCSPRWPQSFLSPHGAPLPHQETESVEVSCTGISVGACDTSSTHEWGGGSRDSWGGLCSKNSHLVILESGCQDLRKFK